MGTSYGKESDIRSKRKHITAGEGDLNYLLNQTNSRICMWDFTGNLVIDGLLNSDVAIEGSNSFSSSSSEVEKNSAAVQLQQYYDYAKDIASGASMFGIGSGLSTRQIRSPLQTVVDWKGSGEFSLTLSVTFICMSPDHDVRNDIHTVMRGVYPSVDFGNSVIVAPLGYAKQLNKTLLPSGEIFDPSTWDMDKYRESGIAGCWGIAIGDWFEAEPIFVMTNASITASREQTIYGSPLYASGSISVKCSQVVSWQMIGKWLKIEGVDYNDTNPFI